MHHVVLRFEQLIIVVDTLLPKVNSDFDTKRTGRKVDVTVTTKEQYIGYSSCTQTLLLSSSSCHTKFNNRL